MYHARLVDFENPENNEFLAVNQFIVIEGQQNRRPDIVIFVNGLILAFMELKNPGEAMRTPLSKPLSSSSIPT